MSLGPPTDSHCRTGCHVGTSAQLPRLGQYGPAAHPVHHLLHLQPLGTWHVLTIPCSPVPGSITAALHPVSTSFAYFVRAFTLHVKCHFTLTRMATSPAGSGRAPRPPAFVCSSVILFIIIASYCGRNEDLTLLSIRSILHTVGGVCVFCGMA